MKDADYFAENPDEFEALEDAQKEAIFNGETIEPGDTSEVEERTIDEEVSESPDTDESKEKEPEEPTILAKDGEHTIPYSELESARSEAEKLKELTDQQAKLIADLQAAKNQDDSSGEETTEAQDKVLKDLATEYPEIAEDLKPMIERIVQQKLESVEKAVDEKVAPIQQTAYEVAAKAREDAILAAHPDAVDVYQSKELQDWIDQQPSFAQDQYREILKQSTAEQMIELFDAYKAANGVDDQPVDEVAEKAKAKLAQVKPKVPLSLSDVPAGQARKIDESEAMLEMSPAQLDQKFAGKSPEQIREILAKLV